jgi:hypothetical protein
MVNIAVVDWDFTVNYSYLSRLLLPDIKIFLYGDLASNIQMIRGPDIISVGYCSKARIDLKERMKYDGILASTNLEFLKEYKAKYIKEEYVLEPGLLLIKDIRESGKNADTTIGCISLNVDDTMLKKYWEHGADFCIDKLTLDIYHSGSKRGKNKTLPMISSEKERV